jgi:hypothetical protein
MFSHFIRVLAVVAVVFIGAQESFSQGKFSGYMFGDLYYVSSNHDPSIEGRNGFWFRRIYFTYDQGLSEQFAVRFRLEMNSDGNFTSASNLQPYIKDAYLKWTRSGHAVLLGVSPTPTWEYFEEFWGYRSVEKTPADLYKFGSSRDFGLAVKGSLGSAKNVKYHFMFSNGGGTNGADTNEGKKLMLAVAYEFSKNLFVEAYGDWEERPGPTNRYSAQGVVGYKNDKVRLGVQLLHQTREGALTDLNLQVASGFIVVQAREKLAGFLRYDRLFDRLPDGPSIAYIPFSNAAKANFVLAGLDYTPHAQVHFMPNLELVFYDETNGTSPDTDFIPRLTFYYIWK